MLVAGEGRLEGAILCALSLIPCLYLTLRGTSFLWVIIWAASFGSAPLLSFWLCELGLGEEASEEEEERGWGDGV